MSHASQKTVTVPFSGQRFTPVAATQWRGETGVVGSFSTEKLAHYFAAIVLEKDPGGTTACYVFRRAETWFVDLCKQKH